MELFNAKVHQTYVRPWAYRLFQYKSLPMPEKFWTYMVYKYKNPPLARKSLGKWGILLQKSAIDGHIS